MAKKSNAGGEPGARTKKYMYDPENNTNSGSKYQGKNNYAGAVTDVLFSLTEVRSSNGFLTKSLTMDATGKLEKKPAANMDGGTGASVTLALGSFPDFIQGLKKNQAITHGICRYDTVNIVAQHKYNGQPDTITRTKKYFSYPAGHTLAMIDYDPDDGQPVLGFQDVIEKINAVCPGFKDVSKVLTYSTSSCIYTSDGTEITGKGAGFHLYFVVQNGQDLDRFKTALFQRLWLAGHGYIKIASNGRLLKRTIFDDAVFSPERLDFCAGAVLGDGLIQRRPNPEYIPGSVAMLDPSSCSSLNQAEQSNYESKVNAGKTDAGPQAEQIKEQYIETHIPKLVEARANIGKPISIEDAAKTVRARCAGANVDIYGDDVLLFDDLGAATVADVLADPGKYDGHTLSDPIEPEAGRCKARFERNAGKGAGKPVIHSFVHGGQVYFLHAEQPRPAETVEDVLAWIETTKDHREILKEWVKKLRGMDLSEQEEIKQAVQKKTKAKISILNKQLKDQQAEWTRKARKKAQVETSQKRQAAGIQEIPYCVTATGECCHAVSKALRDHKEALIYRHGGSPIKIINKPPSSVRMVKKMADQGAEYPAMPMISQLGMETLTHEVEKVAVCQVKQGDDVKDISWPKDIMRGTQALTEYHEHNLVGIVEHPYIDYNFQPVTSPGYDPSTGLYKCFNGQIRDVFKNANDAMAFLCEDVFDEFNFANEIDRFASVSCLLTGMQRRLIVDNSGCPGYLISAPIQSSGKTTLAQIISYALYSRPMAASTFTDDDTEMAKHLLGILMEGHPCVLFDNIPEGSTIESNELAKAITSDSYSNRILSKNKTATMPSSVLWMFTGNNVSVCGDFNTRILPIELDPRVASPDQRKFKRVDVSGWCEENREKILSACTKVIIEGKDYEPDSINPSRFPTWDRFVRYPIYKIVGQDIAEIFQKNKLADPKLEGQRAFFETWYEIFGSRPVTAKDVLNKCREVPAGYSVSDAISNADNVMGDAVRDIFTGRDLPSTRAMGKWLSSMKNRFFGDYKLVQGGKLTTRQQKGHVCWIVTEMD